MRHEVNIPTQVPDQECDTDVCKSGTNSTSISTKKLGAEFEFVQSVGFSVGASVVKTHHLSKLMRLLQLNWLHALL